MRKQVSSGLRLGTCHCATGITWGYFPRLFPGFEPSMFLSLSWSLALQQPQWQAGWQLLAHCMCQRKPQHAHCAILNYRWNILTMQLFDTSCYVYNRKMAVMQCATVCLYLLGLTTGQRLQSHVCSTFFLFPWSFWLSWSCWALIVYLYSSPSAIELCSVLFLLVLRLARNSTSTECREFRTGWRECNSTSTLPAGVTQWSSIHLLSRTQRKPISHQESTLHQVHSGEAAPTQRTQVQPWWNFTLRKSLLRGSSMFSNVIFLSLPIKCQ